MNEVSKRKGLLLAGGKATRLYPATSAVNKHLLPIFDKPMVFYSLSILMLSKIREVAIVSSEKDIHFFKQVFGDGSHLGMNISYIVQKEALGIANAIDISRSFIAGHHLAVILGDASFENSASYESRIPTRVFPEPGTPESKINFLLPVWYDWSEISCARLYAGSVLALALRILGSDAS